jgi:hypothetical protein
LKWLTAIRNVSPLSIARKRWSRAGRFSVVSAFGSSPWSKISNVPTGSIAAVL